MFHFFAQITMLETLGVKAFNRFSLDPEMKLQYYATTTAAPFLNAASFTKFGLLFSGNILKRMYHCIYM